MQRAAVRHRRAITVARLARRSRCVDGLARACAPDDTDNVPHPARQHVSRRTFTPTRANTVSSFGASMRRALHKHHR